MVKLDTKAKKIKLLEITKAIKDNLIKENSYSNNFKNVSLSRYNESDARDISMMLKANKNIENYIASKFKLKNDKAKLLTLMFDNAVLNTHSFNVNILSDYIFKQYSSKNNTAINYINSYKNIINFVNKYNIKFNLDNFQKLYNKMFTEDRNGQTFDDVYNAMKIRVAINNCVTIIQNELNDDFISEDKIKKYVNELKKYILKDFVTTLIKVSNNKIELKDIRSNLPVIKLNKFTEDNLKKYVLSEPEIQYVQCEDCGEFSEVEDESNDCPICGSSDVTWFTELDDEDQKDEKTGKYHMPKCESCGMVFATIDDQQDYYSDQNEHYLCTKCYDKLWDIALYYS